MLECATHFLMVEHLSGRIFDPPLSGPGYRRLLNPYRRPYPTKDGFIGVLPYAEKHWVRFMEVVGRPDVAAEPWFRDPVARSEKIHELCRVIDEAMPARTTAEWLALLRAADIPCGPVNTLEVFDERRHFRAGTGPCIASIAGKRVALTVCEDIWGPDELGFAYDEDPVAEAAGRPAPRLGEHGRAILAEAGLSDTEIDALVAAGAVGQAG